MSTEKILFEGIEEFQEVAFELSYHLTDNPELPGEEYESSKKIVEILNRHKIDSHVNYYDLETAFIGKVIEKPESPINIGIITEYDALPEIGHACGHSASAAISVLSALVLKANEANINANVDIIGTPDEENEGLKIPMTDNGAFDKYDFVIMVHLDTQNSPNGKFLAFETYHIDFIGKPAHTAASPWDGRSAMDGLMLSIHGFDMLRKCAKPGTVIEGFIENAGIATNIIPDKARGKYTFRSPKSGYITDELMPWVRDVVEGCAKATQTQAEIKPFGYPFKDMKYNQFGTDVIKGVMDDIGLENSEDEVARGSSDIGNVSYSCPAFHPFVAITDEKTPLHTKEFADVVKTEKSETVIIKGTKVILGFIARMLDNPEYLEKMKAEFNQSK